MQFYNCRRAELYSATATKIFLVMRITAGLLLVFSLHLSAKVNSQISLHVKNATLAEVFDQVQHQTGYTFLYTNKTLDGAKRVSIDIDNVRIDKFLDVCFRNQPLSYKIDGETVFVSANEDAAPVLNRGLHFSGVEAPPVTGMVRDADGNVLAGINITIKGKQGGVRSAADGSFVISAEAGEILIFSSVEFETKEYKLSAKEIKTKLNINLERKITALRQVELNKGYYSVKDELNTGSVFTVKGDDIRKQPVTDPVLALEGRVPGLSISQIAGVPGAPMKIQLRGQNFFRNTNPAANDPLYIVDGLPFSSQPLIAYTYGGVLAGTNNVANTRDGVYGLSPFNMLNPANIENIEILKDADATAIYGSQGANGVIVITTKKSKAGEAKIDISFSQGYSKQAVSTKLMNTQQYLAMMREAFKNDGQPFPSLANDTYNSYPYLNSFWDTSRSTDWSKLFTGKAAVFINAHAGISGGTANTRFLVGGDYNKNGAYFPGNFSDQRGGANFSISHTSTNQRFHLDASGSYMNENNNLPGGDLAHSYQYAPDAPALYDKNGNLNWQLYEGSATWSNPLAAVNIHQQSLINLLSGNLGVSYQLVKGLQFKTGFGYSSSNGKQQTIYPSTTIAPPDNTDPNNREFYFSTTTGTTLNIEPQLSYNLRLGKGTLDVLLGTTIRDNKLSSIAYFAYGYSNDALISNLTSASSGLQLNYSNSSEYRYNSIYGRIGYNWDQKYVLNLTARRDGSSRFGPGHQFGDFGSVGAGWIFSKEHFSQVLFPWLSFGKLRASYGVAGSDGIADYGFLSRYNTTGSGTYQGVTLLSSSGVIDPYFHWQRNKELEGALELGFLKDRINATISYHRNRSDNQLTSYTLAYVTGNGGVTTNFPALVENSGWEFTLNTFNLRGKALSWSTSVNLTIPESVAKLVAYPGLATSSYSRTYAIGKSILSPLVYHYLGVDTQKGIYQFAAADNSGIPSDRDRIFIHPVTQHYYGGVGNTICYKGLSVSFFFEFKKQLGYSYQKAWNVTPGIRFNQPPIVLDRWQKPGDITNVQRFFSGNGNYAPSLAFSRYFLNSDGIITDASYIRFKTLSVSYQLPHGWLQRAHLQGGQLTLSCNNLLTITGYQVLDPETQNFLAPTRTLTAGINITL